MSACVCLRFWPSLLSAVTKSLSHVHLRRADWGNFPFFKESWGLVMVVVGVSWKEWISYGFLFLLFCEEISIFNYQARLLFFSFTLNWLLRFPIYYDRKTLFIISIFIETVQTYQEITQWMWTIIYVICGFNFNLTIWAMGFHNRTRKLICLKWLQCF